MERIIVERGGFIETPIRAGANISVTKDSSGTWVISGISANAQIPTGTIDGMNQTFTFTNAPTVIIVDQGRTIINGDGFTLSGNVATLDVAPTFSIFSI